MTQGRPARLIVTTALPLMLGSVFQQMYTVVDASVVGLGIGMEALAALGEEIGVVIHVQLEEIFQKMHRI